jgi:hypothetical protein
LLDESGFGEVGGLPFFGQSAADWLTWRQRIVQDPVFQGEVTFGDQRIVRYPVFQGEVTFGDQRIVRYPVFQGEVTFVGGFTCEPGIVGAAAADDRGRGGGYFGGRERAHGGLRVLAAGLDCVWRLHPLFPCPG